MRASPLCWGLALTVALAMAGCSALVNPDESRLGGAGDAGTGDGGRPDVSTPDGGGDSGPMDGGGPDAADTGTDTGGGCSGGCDDGIDCTTDECVAGSCVSTPNDGACGGGEVCDPRLGCSASSCTTNADCDDGAYCNGVEACDPGNPAANARGCIGGGAPSCDDGVACTADSCDEAADACVNEASDMLCDDGIDCTDDTCRPGAGRADERGCIYNPRNSRCSSTDFCSGGNVCSIEAGGCTGGTPRDCSDGDVCTTDSCDSAASMCVHVGRDEDGDGAFATHIGSTSCPTGTDCDDGNPSVHPGATELCNMIDDDCDGLVDELCTPIPDTCGSAEEISVTVGGSTTTIMGSLGSFASDYQSPCGSPGGRDAVYYVDVTTPVDLLIDTIGSAADTVVAVALDCSSDGFRRLGCDDDIDLGVDLQSRVWVHRFGPPPGTSSARLYILVDGRTSSETGTFQLNVRASMAAADACLSPIDISGGGALIGFIAPSTASVGYRGSCQSDAAATESEAIATIYGPPDGDIDIDAFSNFFDPDLYLHRNRCATGPEVDCVAGDGFGAAGFRYHTRMGPTSTTPGGDYYLFVDGVDMAGAYLVSYEP